MSHSETVKYDSPKTKSISCGSVSLNGDNGVLGSAIEVIPMRIADISTASVEHAVCPVAGTVIAVRSVLYGAIATADADLTFSINGVAITNGVITVANSGSAAGDVDVAVPTGANTVAVGDYVSCATDGASTNAVPVAVHLVVRRSA